MTEIVYTCLRVISNHFRELLVRLRLWDSKFHSQKSVDMPREKLVSVVVFLTAIDVYVIL